jgi:purine-nucleoside phosphorylase
MRLFNVTLNGETMSKQEALANAKNAAKHLRNKLDLKKPEIGIVLGTGWGNRLHVEEERSVGFEYVPGFSKLPTITGHARRFVAGTVGGKEVVALRGRVHLNEHPTDPRIPEMVRLQIQTLMELGIRKLVLTNAAGALPNTNISVGGLVVAEAFMTLLAPPMPLFAGEFCSPEDTLTNELVHIATSPSVREGYRGGFYSGCYAMVRGPFFEGRKADKQALRNMGASVVGMSTLPEACIASLYGAKVIALSFVTNDSEENHSHEMNMQRAEAAAEDLGGYLTRLISVM